VRTSTVSGTVFYDHNSSATINAGDGFFKDVTIQLLDSNNEIVAETKTDTNGYYSFNNLIVDETLQYKTKIINGLPNDLTQTYYYLNHSHPNAASVVSDSFTIPYAGSVTDVDFGYKDTTQSVSGTVWFDQDKDGTIGNVSNEPRISGVTVTTTGTSDNGVTVSETTTTDDQGNYSFMDIPPGTYSITVVKANSNISDFTQTYDLDGVSTANASSVIVTNASVEDVNFGYVKTFTLITEVWLDWNRDGVRDSNDVAIPHVSIPIELHNADDNSLIATKNQFLDQDQTVVFDNLPAGNYYVTIPASAYQNNGPLHGLIPTINGIGDLSNTSIIDNNN